VRKQSFGVGVERTFPLHSPKIETLEVAARGDVRRAKLYYLRGRIGKAARVAERRWGIDEELISTPAPAVDAEGVSQAEDEAAQVEEPEAAEAPAEDAEAPKAEEPEMEADQESGAEAGETEGDAAAEGAEDESPQVDPGDSDEDPA